MNEEMSDLPQAETADPDGVQVALRAAQTLWSRGDTSESLKWLRKAAESASDEGADVRSLQLAKAAAELRAKLFGGGDSARTSAGEISGAHPIAEHAVASTRSQVGALSSRPEGDAGRSSFPPAVYAVDMGDAAGSAENASSQSSRPVTATQYPSHRPRQRIGLTSSIPGAPPSPREAYGTRDGAYATRESAAYAAVPSWSADAERRAAPPPLPLSAIDDYEELEAEPDDEPADDPGSIWSGAGESWRPSSPVADGSDGRSSLAPEAQPGSSSASAAGALSASSLSASSFPPSRSQPLGPSGTGSGQSSALPPPLPPRGAFADDGDFESAGDAPTVVIPSADEAGASPAPEPRWTDSGDVWDRESRLSGWDQDSGGSWAADLHGNGWAALRVGSAEASMDGSQAVDFPVAGAASPVSDEGQGSPEPAPPSDSVRAKLTARVHHQAVRVSFAPDLRAPGQYVVRPLREGEKAAAGERIALLVALEPGVPLV